MLREHRGFSSGLVLEPPHRAPSALCGRFAASGETSRLLRAGFGYEEGVPALPISRERGGLVHRRCAGQGWPFRHFSLRLTAYLRRSNCFSFSRPISRWPCRSSVRADAASATSASRGNRSPLRRSLRRGVSPTRFELRRLLRTFDVDDQSWRDGRGSGPDRQPNKGRCHGAGKTESTIGCKSTG
jgi:hypothetical protein